MKMHQGKTDCSPREVDYDPRAVERLDALTLDLISNGTVQFGAYLMARRGKVFAHKSAGRLKRAKDSPDFMPDSLFPIASLTKAFTAAGIWQLLEQGKIHVTQAVSSVLKEFDTPHHKDISIFNLLTHTSGLAADSGGFLEPYPRPWNDNITPDTWIREHLSGPLQFKRGTVWNYCSKGFQFLAAVIERVSGRPFDAYVEEHIWKPLGMTDAHFFLPEEKRDRTASVSDWNDYVINRKRKDPVIPALLGGGGAICSLPAVYRFAQTLLSRGVFNGTRILQAKTVEAGTKPQVTDMRCFNWQGDPFDGATRVTYGLGLEIDKHCFTTDGTYDHEGAGGVFMYIDPREDFLFTGFYGDEPWHGESWIRPLAVAWSGIE